MTNAISPRAVFGVIVPSTNTVVESEYYSARPTGVSYHIGRIYIENERLDSNEVFEAFLKQLREEIRLAIVRVMTCKPDRLIMGMSAETFWGGAEGNGKFERWVKELSGLEVTTGASATDAALRAMGARRIGVITPYQPVADEQVRRYFTEVGFDVAAVYGMKCPTATAIADVSPSEVEAAFRLVDGPGVDALVQVGTNLPVMTTAARLERELGKPVIAINAATNWHALRSAGINDHLEGRGRLFEAF